MLKRSKVYLYFFIAFFTFFVVVKSDVLASEVESISDVVNILGEDKRCFQTGFSEEADAGFEKFKEGLRYVPVLGPMLANIIGYVEFYIRGAEQTISGIISDANQGTDFLAGLANAVGNASEILFLNNDANTLFQQTFSTNQYCGTQPFYKEDTAFLENDYSMFPVLPLNIGLDNDGFCDVSNLNIGSEERMADFRRLGLTAGNIQNSVEHNTSSTTAGTKCSYSYSNVNLQCIIENSLPIVIEGELGKIANTVVCLNLKSLKDVKKNIEQAKSKVKLFKSVLSLTTKVGTIGVSLASSLFLEPLFDMDPVSAKYYYGLSGVIMGIENLIGSFNIPCLITALINVISVVDVAMPATIDITSAAFYDRAKTSMENIKFCGHNWYNYNQTKDGSYYEKGSFGEIASGEYKGSYSKCVSLCAGGETLSCYSCLKKFNKVDSNSEVDVIIKNDILDGLDVVDGNLKVEEFNATTNTVWNKIFREYVYGGVEYADSSPINLSCYDPRKSTKKGFYSVKQRYYMRGNDKANYACNRFMYSGNGCVLPESEIDENDRQKFVSYKIGGQNFYEVVNDANYDLKCINYFSLAYECCSNRTKRFVCLTNTSNEGEVETKFCKANLEQEQFQRSLNLVSIIGLSSAESENEGNKSSQLGIDYGICSFKVGSAKVNMLAVKKSGNNYACVVSDNLCPYNFKLNAGLNYRSSYCDDQYLVNEENESNGIQQTNEYKGYSSTSAETCRKGVFRGINCERLTQHGKNYSWAYDKIKKDLVGESYNDNNSYNFNDYNTIASVDGMTNAYGRVKNFCQYKAHCVKVEPEDILDYDPRTTSAFMDASCSGDFTNSRNNFEIGIDKKATRQLSARVVECVYESLKNLVNGVAGYSSCKSTSGKLNSYGYCGNDTDGLIKLKLNSGKLEDKEYIENRYYFVRGQELPDEINPFIRLQKKMSFIVKVALSLALVVWGFKIIVLGGFKETKDFSDRKFVNKIMMTVIKFSVICWLALNSGWRDGLSNVLLNFATDLYAFTNRILVGALNNEHFIILKDKVVVSIMSNSKDSSSIENVSLCYKYNMFGDLEINFPNANGKCNKGNLANNGIVISSNSEISTLNYYIYKLNNNISNNSTTYNLGVMVSGEGEDTKIFVPMWNEDENKYNSFPENVRFTTNVAYLQKMFNMKYDGCYFDKSEYPTDKSYISIFDTLDCKIVRYLGFGPGLNIANIFLIPLMLMFASALASFLLGLVISFVFVLFNFIIEACYIFLMSFFTLSLLIFVSPVILPFALFERTKSIFNRWFDKIISIIFQPVLMIVTIVLYINIIDIIVLKDTGFKNFNFEGRYPSLDCTGSQSFFCIINDTSKIFSVVGGAVADGFTLVKSLVSGDGFDLSSMPILSLILDMLIVFMLFKLADHIIKCSQTMSETLFGRGTNAGNVQGGISGGLEKASKMSKDFTKLASPATKALGNTVVRGIPEVINKASGNLAQSKKDNLDRNSEKLDKKLSKLENKDPSKLSDKEKSRMNALRSSIAENDGKLGKAKSSIVENSEKVRKMNLAFEKAGAKLEKAKIYTKGFVTGSKLTQIDKVSIGGNLKKAGASFTDFMKGDKAKTMREIKANKKDKVEAQNKENEKLNSLITSKAKELQGSNVARNNLIYENNKEALEKIEDLRSRREGIYEKEGFAKASQSEEVKEFNNEISKLKKSVIGLKSSDYGKKAMKENERKKDEFKKRQDNIVKAIGERPKKMSENEDFKNAKNLEITVDEDAKVEVNNDNEHGENKAIANNIDKVSEDVVTDASEIEKYKKEEDNNANSVKLEGNEIQTNSDIIRDGEKGRKRRLKNENDSSGKGNKFVDENNEEELEDEDIGYQDDYDNDEINEDDDSDVSSNIENK